MDKAEAEIFDPEEYEELERDVVDLQSQLEGLQSADVTSASSAKLIAFVNKEEESDMLIVGEEENRWKELVVPEVEEVKDLPPQKGCCSVQ